MSYNMMIGYEDRFIIEHFPLRQSMILTISFFFARDSTFIRNCCESSKSVILSSKSAVDKVEVWQRRVKRLDSGKSFIYWFFDFTIFCVADLPLCQNCSFFGSTSSSAFNILHLIFDSWLLAVMQSCHIYFTQLQEKRKNCVIKRGCRCKIVYCI
jgi:hypothetical protein